MDGCDRSHFFLKCWVEVEAQLSTEAADYRDKSIPSLLSFLFTLLLAAVESWKEW